MATLAEIRQQYPQYNDMSDAQLADAMHQKFYADMPRAEFDKRLGITGAPERSVGARAVRAAALPVKGLEDSILGVVGGIPDIVAKGLQMAGVPGQKPGMYTDALKQLFMPGAEKLQPETTTEQALYGAGHGVGDAAAFMVPAAGAAKLAQAGSMPQRVGQVLASQPVLQGTAGAAGGSVGEATDNPYAGMIAALGVPAVAAASRGATTAGKKGLQTLFPQASDQVVDSTVAKTFENVDMGQAQARLKELVAAKEPVSLFQLGNESTKRLARASAGAPGEGGDIAADILKQQRAGMGERVQGDVAKAFRGNDAFEMEPALLSRLSQNANQAYGKFYDQVPYVWSGDLAEMFAKRPSLREAIGTAMRNAAEEGKPFGITKSDGTTMMAKDFDKGEAIQALSSRAVDDVKKALDGIIDANKNEFTGKLNNYGRLVTQTKEQFLRAVEGADESGLYKAARAQYAGDAEVVQALRSGKDFAKMDPREIRQFMGQASFAEKDAFRSGMRDAIEQSVKQTKGDKTKALFRKDDWTDEQLKAALDPKDYQALKRTIDARKQGWEDRQFVGARNGSQTQLRQSDLSSMESNVLDTLADVAKGSSIRSAVVNKIVEPMQRRAQGITEQTAPAYVRKLFESDPDKLMDMLLAIESGRSPILNIPRPDMRGGFAGAMGGQMTTPLLDAFSR